MSYKAGVLSAPDGTRLSVLDPTDTGAAHTLIAGVPHTGAMHTDWLRPNSADPAGNGGLVYNGASSTGPAWVRAASPRTTTPAIVYSTYGNLADAKYRYARWNGTGWTKSLIVSAGGSIDISPDEPQYSGGADLDHNDPATVYALARDQSGF